MVYIFKKSTRKGKKYDVYKDGIYLVSFGSKYYQQFKDKLGYYKQLDHGDPVRRASYLARSKGIKNKQGQLTWNNKNSANYWSRTILW